MKFLSYFKEDESTQKNGLAFRGGSYALAISALALAILVVVNIFISALPSSVTKYDISASKLYSITNNTKVVVNGLNQEVTIYWVVQSGQEDSVIENLLSKYDSLSSNISVVKRNPDIYPTFAAQYTDETVQNNSLVVVSGERSRFISYSDIYVQEADMYSYTYTTSFDGEGAITSAIDYVINEDLPKLYLLEGHGESALPSSFSQQIEKENIETESFSLLNTDEVPEDADCVLIYAPSSDISTEERDILASYVKNGGKLYVIAGTTESGHLENLYSLLEDYNISAVEGIAVEESRDYYAFQAPYILLPTIESSDITNSLIEENYYVIMPISTGLSVGSTSNATVTTLLSTSDTSFSKIDGYALTTYEKEENDIDGPFALAVSIENDNEGQMIWFTSSSFLEDMYNAYSSGANLDISMNALSSLIGEREAMAIRSKSLNYNYLTISDSTSSFLKVLMIAVFPLLYFSVGIFIMLKRRRMQNETL